MKILVADDDKDLLRMAETILRAAGHHVLRAVDASQVIPIAQRDRPDLILLDVNMPGGKGNEILGRLKRSSVTSGIAVIIVTASQDPALRTVVDKAGAEGFLQKPWLPDTLVDQLKGMTPFLAW